MFPTEYDWGRGVGVLKKCCMPGFSFQGQQPFNFIIPFHHISPTWKPSAAASSRKMKKSPPFCQSSWGFPRGSHNSRTSLLFHHIPYRSDILWWTHIEQWGGADFRPFFSSQGYSLCSIPLLNSVVTKRTHHFILSVIVYLRQIWTLLWQITTNNTLTRQPLLPNISWCEYV